MTDTTLVDLESTVDAHLAGYCEPDAARRLALLTQAWSPDGRLFDPPFDGTGPDGIAALVDAVLEHYPAHTFRRTSGVDAHHTLRPLRLGARWRPTAPSRSPAPTS